MEKAIIQLAKKTFFYAQENRRWFHRHPELSHQEYKTTQHIKEQLTAMGIKWEQITETGVIGTIRGRYPGKILGIRADIDALPIKEMNVMEYCSQNEGVMHACGHDAHAAALLGTAKILKQVEEKLHGTVKLIFQPAEEYFPSGAKEMIDSGLLDDCDSIIGIHVLSDIPIGKICVQEGARMAASATVRIRVKGKGGHGGMPHQSVDAVVTAAAIIMNLQTLISRELDINNSAVLSIGVLKAGTERNIIAEEAEMMGTLRYFDNHLLQVLSDSIIRIAENTAAAYRATAEVDIIPGLPAVINDEAMAKMTKEVAKSLFGENALVYQPKAAGVDDFAYYAVKAPIVYAFVGCGNSVKGADYPHHNPKFNIDEDCLEMSMAWFVGVVYRYLKVDKMGEGQQCLNE